MARQTLEDKVQYRTDVKQKAQFRKTLLIVLGIAAIAIAGYLCKDQILHLIKSLPVVSA